MVDQSTSRVTQSPLNFKQAITIVGFVAMSVVVIFGALLLLFVMFPSIKLLGAVPIVGGFLMVVISAIYGVILTLLRRWKIPLHDIGFRKPTKRLWHLLWQTPLLITAAVLMEVLVSISSKTSPKSDAITDVAVNASAPWIVVILLLICVLTPLWEEVVFRGIIYGGLRRKFSIVLAVICSAIIFALAHISPMIMPYITVLGLGLALVYEFHRTLIASVIVHMVVNTLASIVIIQALFA